MVYISLLCDPSFRVSIILLGQAGMSTSFSGVNGNFCAYVRMYRSINTLFLPLVHVRRKCNIFFEWPSTPTTLFIDEQWMLKVKRVS